MTYRPEPDRAVLEANGRRMEFAALALCAIGLVMVYAATAPFSDKTRMGTVEDTIPTLWSQATKLALGFVAFLLGRAISLDLLKRNAGKLLIFAVFVLALVPFFGITLNYSNRWLKFGSFTFQPVEMVKLAVVAWIAAHLSRIGDRIRDLRELSLVFLLGVGPALLLLFLQPDFGSSVFLLGVALVLVVIAGARFRHYGGGILGGFAALYLAAIAFFPHVVTRFQKHVDPKPGDQVYQALLSFGAGGFAGIDGGIGAGVGKLGFVPMVQSDFIMSAIGEEAGFLGSSIVIALFVMFTYAGARIALLQRERFRFLLACGLVINVAVQALINLVVVTALGPTKGIALPFISSGGSAVMFSLFGVGLLINLARSRAMETEEPERYAPDADTESDPGDALTPNRRPQPARAGAREKMVVQHG